MANSFTTANIVSANYDSSSDENYVCARKEN